MIIGDRNANLGDSGSSIFKPLMLDFCSENNLVISTKTILSPESYSHITTRHDCHFKTWIDHVVTSHDVHRAINNINMLYNFLCDQNNETKWQMSRIIKDIIL